MFKLYEVDPAADALLIVPAPSRAFAPWDEQPADCATPVYAGILRGTSRPPNIYASIASSPELRIKVSSKHLSLASKHFRDKFRWKWAHLDSIEPDGRVHVNLAGFDPQAVIIVMDIIHGRGGKVPKLVDIEKLAKVAQFVDAFKVYEPTQVYAERWIEKLEESLPTSFQRDVVLWIYVSYIFRRAETFKQVTRLAILQSDGPIKSLGLQIRGGLIKAIDEKRQELVKKSLNIVHSTIDDLQDDKVTCTLGCDTVLLGALIKTLHKRKLIWPRPPKPFLKLSFAGISVSVREAESQASQLGPCLWLNSPKPREKTRKRKTPNLQPGQALTPDSSPEPEARFDSHTCDAKTPLAPQLDALETGVDGLELESDLGYHLY